MRLALAPKVVEVEVEEDEGAVVGVSIKHYSNIKYDDDQWVVIVVRRYY
jgi:hypothetical protein